MFDIILDAVLDSVKALPFLFAAYYLIEFLEHKINLQSLQRYLGHHKTSVCVGALLGGFPQCGFSVTAANFYTSRLITPGTLIAVFLATSDEAVPILLAEPRMIHLVVPVLIIKIIAGMITGLAVDMFWHKKEDEPFHDICHGCHCDEHSILHSALHHTMELFVFLLIVNLVLGFIMAKVSDSILQTVFLDGNVLQPLLTALIGLIPNCAASVALTQLYVGGQITFGSMIAGLCSGAGLGIAVLLRTNKNEKENLTLIAILYGAAVIWGMLINAVM